MRIGASLTSAYPNVDARAGATMMIERARAARDAGLWCLTIGDHHVNTRPYFQNTPMLGRLLAEWGDTRPAGCLFLVPLWNPVLMAEQIGTLAAISGEPFIVQTGLGGAEREAMGISGGPRGPVTEDAIAVVKALLAGDKEGDAVISPTPPGSVEWWIGATASAGILRAARLGDCWYAAPGLPLDAAIRRLTLFTEACDRFGTTAIRNPIRRDVLVAPSQEEAERIVGPVIQRGYRGMDPEVLVWGSPAAVAEQLTRFGDAGFTDVIVRQMAVAQGDALRSYELLGEVADLLH